MSRLFMTNDEINVKQTFKQTFEQLVPKWCYNGPKIVVPNGSKMAQNGPKMVPKWSQNNPKMVPKWSRNYPKRVSKIMLK